MPDINFPQWLEWVIIIGAISGAFTAVILFLTKASTGLTWVSKKHQLAVLAPATEEINHLKCQVDKILEELTSKNNGSIREEVNIISRDIKVIQQDRESHRKWCYENHALIDHKLKTYGLAGPIADVDET